MPNDHPTPRMLTGDEADVYREHHARLLAVLRVKVHTTDPIREDACSFAWLQFLRLQPDRDTAFAWLCTTAIREAWRLTTLHHRHRELQREAPAPVDTDLALDARDALNQLANLPDRQRRYLTLLVAGHSYADICHHTGATHTNVNKHLVRARRHLRSIDHLDA
jgi:DNA-directed RNA polymerase specialized sigma24 family protein